MIWSHVFPNLTAYTFPKALLQLLWSPGYSPAPGTLLLLGVCSCFFCWDTLNTNIHMADTLIPFLHSNLRPFPKFLLLSPSPTFSISVSLLCFPHHIYYHILWCIFYFSCLFVTIYKTQNSMRVQIFVCSDFFIDVSTVTWKCLARSYHSVNIHWMNEYSRE